MVIIKLASFLLSFSPPLHSCCLLFAVIDCGFMQVDWFRPEKHFNDRFIVPVCQYTALQRSKWWRYGRFGSTGARVYRLYTREQYESLAARTLTEMRRTDLCGIVLYLKALAVDSVLRFDFPSPPPAKNLLSALETLYALGKQDLIIILYNQWQPFH